MSNPYEQFRQAIMGGLPIDNAVSFDQFQDARLSGLVNSLQPNPQLMNNMSNVSQQINQEQIDKNAKELKRKERRQALEDIAARFGIINAQQSGNYQQANIMQNNLLERQQAREDEKQFARMYATLNDDQKLFVDRKRAGIELPANNQTFERFGVYDLDGKPVGSVSKSNTPKIQEIENNPNYMLGPLSVDNLSETSTENERARTRLLELNSKPELTDLERSEIPMLKTIVYGDEEIIPFFNESGNVLNRVITNWDLSDDPNLTKKLSEQGYVTAGQKPSTIFSAQTNVGNEIGEKWENSTNTLNLINDLATILDEGRNSPTIPGAIGNLINTGIYQFKAAENLLTNYQQQFPKEYSETINYIQNKHGSVLDKISADRGIATSVVMKLAYSLAKQNDPGGRLSDKDVDSAITIIGGSGANVDARLATLKNLSRSIVSEHDTYLDRIGRQYNNNQTIKDSVENFRDLPVFYKSTFNPSPEKITEVGKYKIEVIPQ